VLLAAVLFSGSAIAQAWGQSDAGWAQFQGDGAHVGAGSGAPPPYREAWRFDPGLSGRFGVSAAVVAGDVAVAVAPRAVYGVDLATGEAAWEVPRAYGPSVPPAVAGEAADLLIYTEGYGTNPPDQAYPSAAPSGSASATSGASTPSSSSSPSTVASDASGSDDEADTRVQALDLANQRPAWKQPVPLQAVSRTGVTVDGDTAFVGDDDGVVTAIDVSTGEVRWTFDAPGPVATSIAAASDTVVFSTQPRKDEPAVLIAVHAADGSEAWRFDSASGPFVASVPTIAGDTVLAGFLDQSGSRVRALSLADGTERWARSVTSQVSFLTAPVATSEAVYVLDISGQIRALAPATGDDLWDYAINSFVPRGVPVVASSAVLVPTNRGSLVAIDTVSHDLVALATASGPQGHLGALAVTPSLVIAVKGGHSPGLVGFEHDDGIPLLNIPSPTVLAPGRMVASFAVVAIPMFVLLALAGRWLRRRIGPAFDDGDGVPNDAEGPEAVTEG
jgi:outer membrane protein assembly factor BamB